MADQVDPRFEDRLRSALRSAESSASLTPADILARRTAPRRVPGTGARSMARAAMLAAAALVLLPLGALLVVSQQSSESPSPTPGTWTMTGQQLIDTLTADYGYVFGDPPGYVGDAWYGPKPPTEDDVASGGTGSVTIRAPFHERAHVEVKTGLASAASAEGGCRYVWRILDLLVPDSADQQAVWETLNGVIDQAGHRADPSYALANAHQDVAGGAVYLEFIVVATDDGGAPIADPTHFGGGIAFEFRPTGATAEVTPRPDRAIETQALTASSAPAALPDLSACSRPPDGTTSRP